MMENLIVATNAVIPFMVYILLGAVSKKMGFVKEGFLKELNGVVFKVFFPFIMFNNLYDVDFGKLSDAGYVGFAVAATLIVIIASFLLVPLFSKDNRRRCGSGRRICCDNNCPFNCYNILLDTGA